MPYDNLLALAKRYPDSVDFTELRMSFVESSSYEPYNFNNDSLISFEEAESILSQAIEKNNLSAAVEAIDTLLAINYLDINTHIIASNVFSQLGNTQKKEHHEKVARGLLQSIYKSGDGRSYETAFVVIDTKEEYVILGIYGVKIISQSLVVHDDSEYDVFILLNPKTGGQGNMYFNIDIPKSWLKRWTDMNFPKELDF